MLCPGFLFVCVMMLVTSSAVGQRDVTGGGLLSVEVLHSLDDEGLRYSPRGLLSLDTDTSATYRPTDTLSHDDVTQLRRLVQRDGYYRVQLRGQYQDGSLLQLNSFCKASQLICSQLNDTLTLTISADGRPLAVNQVTSRRCHDDQQSDELAALKAGVSVITSTLVLQHADTAPVPDTTTFIHKMEQEKLKKERGETKDDRSFLAKYWMYIIPTVLAFMIIGGGEQTDNSRR